MSVSVVDLQARIDQLTAENAELRERLGADMAEERTRYATMMVREAMKQEASKLEHTMPPSVEARLCSLQQEGTGLRNQLQETLRSQDTLRMALGDAKTENAFLHNTVDRLQRDILPALRKEVDEVTCKKDQLQRQLEESSSSTDTERISLQLRAEESAQQIAHLQSALAEREAKIIEQNSMMSKYVHQYQTATAATKEENELVVSRTEERDGLKRELESLQEEMKKQLEEQQSEYTMQLENLQRDRDHFKRRHEECIGQLETAQVELLKVSKGVVEGSVSPMPESAPVGSKRGRSCSQGGIDASGPTLKRDMIQFWCNGHDEIDRLKQEIALTKSTTDKFEQKAAEVKNIIATRNNLVAAHCAVTTELERCREERHRALANVSALEVQNELLTSHLSSVLESEMDPAELKQCAASILEHASRAAAANTSLIYDEASQRKALQESQMLRHELRSLESNKEELKKVIGERERALSSLQGTLGCGLLAARSVRLGDGTVRIGTGELMSIFKDLQSPYLDLQADVDHKQKLTDLYAKVQTAEASKDSLLTQANELNTKLNAALQEKDFEKRAGAAEVSALRGEVQEATKTVDALACANRRLKEAVKRLTQENEELNEGANAIKGTSVQVIELFSREIAKSQQLRQELDIVKAKLTQYEGTKETGHFHRMMDGEAEMIAAALQRHAAAIETHLEIEKRKQQREDSSKEDRALQLLESKDQKLAETVATSTEALQTTSQTVGRLDEELTQAKIRLVEAENWAATAEQKVRELTLKLNQADQHRQFVQTKVGQVWLQGTIGSQKKPATAPEGAARVQALSSEQSSCLSSIKHALGLDAAAAAAVTHEPPATATPVCVAVPVDEEEDEGEPVEEEVQEEALVVQEESEGEGDEAPPMEESSTVIVEVEGETSPVSVHAGVSNAEVASAEKTGNSPGASFEADNPFL